MKELLFTVRKKDFEIQSFQSGGKGGQHQNKTDSGVRIIHRASGAVGVSRTDRSQHKNKKMAFNRLVQSIAFQQWAKRVASRIVNEKSVGVLVEEQMSSKNLKVEIRDNSGKWSPELLTEKS